MRSPKLFTPVLFAVFVSIASACGSADGWFYPYDYDYNYDWWEDEAEYPWWNTPFGGYTIIRRPVTAVDAWTTRAFAGRPYRGYRVRRHNSPVIVYSATRGDRTLDVNLTPLGDSTRVEVRARRGKNRWEKQQAKMVLGSILREGK